MCGSGSVLFMAYMQRCAVRARTAQPTVTGSASRSLQESGAHALQGDRCALRGVRQQILMFAREMRRCRRSSVRARQIVKRLPSRARRRGRQRPAEMCGEEACASAEATSTNAQRAKRLIPPDAGNVAAARSSSVAFVAPTTSVMPRRARCYAAADARCKTAARLMSRKC